MCKEVHSPLGHNRSDAQGRLGGGDGVAVGEDDARDSEEPDPRSPKTTRTMRCVAEHKRWRR